jgi:hypothetical protein
VDAVGVSRTGRVGAVEATNREPGVDEQPPPIGREPREVAVVGEPAGGTVDVVGAVVGEVGRCDLPDDDVVGPTTSTIAAMLSRMVDRPTPRRMSLVPTMTTRTSASTGATAFRTTADVAPLMPTPLTSRRSAPVRNRVQENEFSGLVMLSPA